MKILAPFLALAFVVGVAAPAAASGPYDGFIKEVQQKLNELGFDAGTVNGDFGERTQAALAQFQLAHLIPASGALDDETLKALGIERPAEDASASQAG